MKASGSGATPKTRLCSPDGQTPLGALRAWILAYGSRLEEDSRRDVSSRVWTKVLPKKLLRRSSSDGGRPERAKRNEQGREREGDTEEMAEQGGAALGDPRRPRAEGEMAETPAGTPNMEEGGPPAGEVKGNPMHNSDGATHPETHFIGEHMEDEGGGRPWGHPIILPKRGDDEFGQTQQTEEPNLDPSGPQATGWLKGLEQMDQICPRKWAKHGIRAGRRIPPDFRAPYCSILINICQHHDEAVCRGWTENNDVSRSSSSAYKACFKD